MPRFSNVERTYVITSKGEENLDILFGINGFEYQIAGVVECLRDGKL